MAVPRTEKVLIVDDSSFMRRLVVDAVQNAGYTNIIEAEDGLEAKEMYLREKPDIMLMDLIMPNCTGLEVLESLVPQGAKIIVISAIGQKSIIEDAFLAGAKGYFIKPFFDVPSIQNMLEAVLRGETVKPDYDRTVHISECLEVSQRGANKSASALSVILGSTVLPRENSMHVSKIVDTLAKLPHAEASVVIAVTGLLQNVPGLVRIMLPKKDAYALVDILNRRAVGTTTSLEGDIECSTIEEVLNILSNSYLSVFENKFDLLAAELPHIIKAGELSEHLQKSLKKGTRTDADDVAVFNTAYQIPVHDLSIDLEFITYYTDICS